MGSQSADVPRSGPSAAVHAQGSALDAAELERLERHEIAPGVSYSHLWGDTAAYAGVVWFEPGAELADHDHRRFAHHLWLASGSMETLGRRLDPGAYAFVPVGRLHGSVAGPAGATVFYVNVAMPDTEASG